MSSNNFIVKGIYNDRLLKPDGKISDLGWRTNIVVDRCRFLLAAFMKNDPSMGIQVLKVGKGEDSWDIVSPEPPVRTIEQLVDPDPIDIPIISTQIDYLDAAGNPTEGPSYRLRITIELEPGTPPIESGNTSYPMREFGLFGRLGTEDYMIDYVRHPVINKQTEDTLIRTIRLLF